MIAGYAVRATVIYVDKRNNGITFLNATVKIITKRKK